MTIEAIGIILGLVIFIMVVWAQLRTADEVTKIRKMLERLIDKK